MLKQIARRQEAIEVLSMPDQSLRTQYTDTMAPGLGRRPVPYVARAVLFGLPLTFSAMVFSILVLAFRSGGQFTLSEMLLTAMMALLSGWEAISTANAFLGFKATPKIPAEKQKTSLTVAILVTLRDEIAHDVMPGKLELLHTLRRKTRHDFSLHVLSDSTSAARIDDERRMVREAFPLPVSYHNRSVNTDFKSGNVRNWIEKQGDGYDAFIILDADSELDHATVQDLANALANDPACGLIQTIPVVRNGKTYWQHMQSVASTHYGGLQGQGLSTWMGDEANYYGHNAIIRTRAFAAAAGLPHLKGWGLWNGTILSHDFVEAALLRRAGWGVRLVPSETGSYEQAPTDVIAHLRRDARWCLGNFQHSRILGAAGLHLLSRFHLLSGIFNYLTSVVWLTTLVFWGVLDATHEGVGGTQATVAFVLIAVNLLLPRILGVIHAMARKPGLRWTITKGALTETLFSSIFAPSLMVQRVIIVACALSNRRVTWASQEKASRSLLDFCIFHMVEVLVGLGLLASIERSFLTFWFLPMAVCFALAPVLSWISAQSTKISSHENLNATTPL